MDHFRFNKPLRVTFQVSLGILFLLVSAGGCGKAPSSSERLSKDPNRTLAKIGDEIYTAAEFNDFLLERFPEASTPIPHNNEVLSDLFDQAINERLLLAAARAHGITISDKEVEEYLANSALIQSQDRRKLTSEERDQRAKRAREFLMVDRYVQNLGENQKPILLSEVKSYYDSHLDSFREPDKYHVEEILVYDEPLGQTIEGMLKRGRSFESLAQKYSRNPVASRGGDLGWFARGELPDQFEKAVLALSSGQHTSLIKTDYGFHIFKLKEIRKGHTIPLSAAKPQIIRILEDRERKAAVAQEIARLRQSISISIQFNALGFNYLNRGSATS